jgi:uracil permease
LSLCGSAINNVNNTAVGNYNLWAIFVGLFSFAITVIASVKGKKMAKLIPFIIGIGAGYLLATVLTLLSPVFNAPSMKLIDFTPFTQLNLGSLFRIPEFTFINAINEKGSLITGWGAIADLFVLFAPVAFIVLAEHIADHKNLSSIIEKDLIKEPGLKRTLLGDGVGSIAGAAFGGCPNTTYGESVGCVAITGNASVSTIFITAILCLLLSFFNPFVVFVNTIPVCVVGGICIALYGFIAVSGLKMLQGVDLGDNRNLFVVSAILVVGIGGLKINIGPVTLTNIATALICGILTKLILGKKKED